MKLFLLLLLPLLFFNQEIAGVPFPLSTSSRWIVESSGRRVKLACNTWPAHLESMVAEGMGMQPLDAISKKVGEMGFNCMRLTWPLYLITSQSANMTVQQSFLSLGLTESLAGVKAHNPAILSLTLVDALKAVVSSLAQNNIMVILDNHISKPGWCCNPVDGNGFFGDRYLDPGVWINCLRTMATMFKGFTNVVGMSIRNELRGPRQNVKDWYRYMQMGAEAVHSANPNVLVILSGLTWDTDLSHLWKKQVQLTFTRKLAFEFHWYAFTDSLAWVQGNPNEVCGRVTASVMRRAGFLLSRGFPLILSEFGFDQRGINVNDNRFLNCMLAALAGLDLDWMIWGLPGSYYIKEGVKGFDDVYGVMTWDWSGPRNTTLLQRMQSVQSPFQGPGLSKFSPYNILFHPSTGLCVLRESSPEPLVLGPCQMSEAWTYNRRQTLALKGKRMCLMADGVGKPARLGINCKHSNSKWEVISDSKMHLASKLDRNLCLDVDPYSKRIITNPCKCLNSDSACEPESQWFKIVTSTRMILSKNSSMNFTAQEGTWKLLTDQSP